MNFLKKKFLYGTDRSWYTVKGHFLIKTPTLRFLNIISISTKSNIRNKRTFDFITSIGLLIITPLLIFTFKNKRKFISNVLSVLVGKLSIVGYHYLNNSEHNLPKIKNGILSPADKTNLIDESMFDKLNLIYARDYNISKDFVILKNAWKKLDR